MGSAARRPRRWATLVVCALVTSTSVGADPFSAGAATAAKWSIVPSRNASGADLNSLSGVSCPSPTNCIAVGWGGSESTSKTLVEQWDGAKWSVLPSPNPGPNSSLGAVSCTSDTNCIAVGTTGYPLTKPLVEQWDGANWTVVPSPSFGGGSIALLNAVSCRSATRCMAVGETYDRNKGIFKTFTERWDGSTWSLVPSPILKSAGLFVGVSCVSGLSCMAVGDSYQGATTSGVAASWNGTKWSLLAVPNPPGAREGLTGVFCTSATNCMAGGWSSRSGVSGLVERWNGRKWTVLTSPKLAGSLGAGLGSVTCISPTNCTAAGGVSRSVAHSQVRKTLVEHWNGSSWSVVPTPNPARSYYSSLSSVACTGPTACIAVGVNDLAQQVSNTLVERTP